MKLRGPKRTTYRRKASLGRYTSIPTTGARLTGLSLSIPAVRQKSEITIIHRQLSYCSRQRSDCANRWPPLHSTISHLIVFRTNVVKMYQFQTICSRKSTFVSWPSLPSVYMLAQHIALQPACASAELETRVYIVDWCAHTIIDRSTLPMGQNPKQPCSSSCFGADKPPISAAMNGIVTDPNTFAVAVCTW